jgi:hypothetical protein
VTPGDLVIGGAVIDNTVASTGVKDGAGNVFTMSPNSPCTGGSVTSHAWLFYLLSSPGEQIPVAWCSRTPMQIT